MLLRPQRVKGNETDPHDRMLYASEDEWREYEEDIVQRSRFWQKLPESSVDKPPKDKTEIVFKFLSYNVLAQDLLDEHGYLYRYHHPSALPWENRWRNLLKEIVSHDADILCFQEVQESHLANYYNASLTRLGYNGLFKKRTGFRTDGCAIFYKSSMFKLIEHSSVEYNQGNISVLDRNNVALIAKLAPVNDSSNQFVVATTHLLYNPRRQDVRLAQTQVLLAEIDRIAFKSLNDADEPQYYPVIVSGDFNCEPDSAIVELITKGKLNYGILKNRTLEPTESSDVMGRFLLPPYLRITDQCQHADLLSHRKAKADISRELEEHIIALEHSSRKEKTKFQHQNESLFSSGTLTHSLNLKSVFLFGNGTDTEATTFQNRWITVDYIFYSGAKENKLQVIELFRVPTTRELTKLKYLPNLVLGSDHLALLCKFKLV